MARTLSDILRRFRPAAAPGPAAPPGVPVDRTAESAAELAPVFAALDPAVEEADRRGVAARAEADRRRRRAAEEAGRILADAQSRVEAVRSEAAATALASIDEQRAALERDANAEAARVHEVSEATRADLVARIVADVWRTAGLSAHDTRREVAT